MNPRRGGGSLDSWLLRLGLAFVFGYAAASVFLDPGRFRSYVPDFVPDRWTEPSLAGVAAFEVLLVAGFLTGRQLYAASLLGAALLSGVVALNGDAFDVVFRNVAIAAAALALAVQVRAGAGPAAPAGHDDLAAARAGDADEPAADGHQEPATDVDVDVDLRTTVAVVMPAVPANGVTPSELRAAASGAQAAPPEPAHD